MAREYDAISHAPDYPSWYIAIPSLLLVTAVGLISCGIVALYQPEKSSDLPRYNGLPLGIVLLVFQIYHLVAENHEILYNYYAIVIPDGVIFGWLLVSVLVSTILGVCGKPPKDGEAPKAGNPSNDKGFDIAELVLVLIGWIISVVAVSRFALARMGHRYGGGTSRHHRYRSEAPRAMESDIENVAGSSEDVNMDQLNGDRSPPDDTNVNATNGNRDSFDNVNISQDRASVHYVPGHPYHPLRMNPVDSIGTIRSAAPDVTESKKDTIDDAEQVPKSPKLATPLVSVPLPSRTTIFPIENAKQPSSRPDSVPPLVSKSLSPDDTQSGTEITINADQVPSSHRPTPPPALKSLLSTSCNCEQLQ